MTVGLRLPRDVLQPFFLRLDPDDLHVMALIEGHPAYEAVEAMIRWRAGGEPSVRAILTRHDQTQIDHLNDAERLAGMAGAVRETHARDISVRLEDAPGGRRAEVGFQSSAGEAVAFSISTLFPPSPAGAGLTDPGGHSPTTSLPLMWRRASALAGGDSWVSVDGARYGLPAREVPPASRAGYFTEGHTLGAVRAGATTLTLLGRPDRLEPGQAWTFADEDGPDVRYEIAARTADGELSIARQGGERLLAGTDGDGLVLREIRLGDGDPARDLVLAFGDGDFRIDLEGAEGLVAGKVTAGPKDGGWAARLSPETPGWARPRTVGLLCRRDGDRLTCETTIGAAAGD
jgi:hypothetical protein